MAAADVTLQGKHLTRTFGGERHRAVALDDVCLELRRGQVTLLMGPSGSGKSTLLAVLSGLLPPDRGQVLALGQSLWDMDERQRKQFRQRHVGFVFQGFNLLPALKAYEQVEIVLRWGGNVSARTARQRAEEVLRGLDLGDKLSLRPNELSGGEKQRVAIGRALVKEPDLFFADEPTSALNWEQGERAVRLLQDIAHQRQATVLIVSHDARILPYVDVAWHLEDGKLTEMEPEAARVQG